MDSFLAKQPSVNPYSFAKSTASVLGAPTAIIIGNPARIDFWTSSNEALPETNAPKTDCAPPPSSMYEPTSLSNALCRPTS